MEAESRANAKSDWNDHHNVWPWQRPGILSGGGQSWVQQILLCLYVFLAVAIAPSLRAQEVPEASSQEPIPRAAENAQQVAMILGISQLVSKAQSMNSQRPCQAAATAEELTLRQDILETVVASSLEVDGVLAELDNERAQLFELSATLQARRDRTVNLTNVANLITGTGLG